MHYIAVVTSDRINLSPFTKDFRGGATCMRLDLSLTAEGRIQHTITADSATITVGVVSDKVSWPSGLRRSTQVRVFIEGVGSNPTGTIFGVTVGD